MSETDIFDADVIVVGAGPIGLTTGCALRHYGVDSLIVEQREDVKANSRANNLWARQQELLAGIGVRDAIAAKAYEVSKIENNFFGERVEPIALDDVASPYPYSIYSGQDVIESELQNCYRARNGKINRGQRVIGFVQDSDGVTVKVTNDPEGEGAELTLRCRYLVGADGVEGTIRKALGLDFETEEYPNRINRTVDAKLSWNRPTGNERMWFFYFEKGFLGILPVWGGYHRMFCISDDADVPDRDPTLEEMQALGRTVTGDANLTFSDPIWFSHNRFQHAVSPSFSKNRVFLAGDAGHFSLPIGGQGMNTGFHDAIGIGWRLAMALDGVAGETILSSYTEERCSEHKRVDRDQGKGFDQLMYRGKVWDAGLKVAANVMPKIGSYIFGISDLHQLKVGYPKSPLSENKMGVLADTISRKDLRAGDRVPHVILSMADGTDASLLDIITMSDGPRWSWTLLTFGTKSPIFDGGLKHSFVRRRHVHNTSNNDVNAGDLFDLDDVLADNLGVDHDGAFVLIRPDGHIALITERDPKALLSYFERHFR